MSGGMTLCKGIMIRASRRRTYRAGASSGAVAWPAVVPPGGGGCPRPIAGPTVSPTVGPTVCPTVGPSVEPTVGSTV